MFRRSPGTSRNGDTNRPWNAQWPGLVMTFVTLGPLIQIVPVIAVGHVMVGM